MPPNFSAFPASATGQVLPWGLLLFCVLLPQFLFVSFTFPISELLSDNPLLYVDGGIHWYRITAAVNLAATGEFNGYDPFFSAGQLIGLEHNAAAKVPAFMAIAFQSILSPGQAWKLYSFLLAVLGPALIPIGLRLLDLPRLTWWIGYCAAIVLWWTSYFRWFHTVGMVSFVFAAYLGFAFTAWVIRWIEGKGSAISLIALGLLGALGTFIHPLFPIPVAFCTFFYLLLNFTQLDWRRVFSLMIVVPLISLAPNVLWLYGALTYESGDPTHISHQSVVDASMIWRELIGQWQDPAHGSRVYPLLAFIAVVGCFFHDDRRRFRLSLGFLFSGMALIVYAAIGAQVEDFAALTQPNRFAPVGYLMILASASIGATALWLRVGEEHGVRRVVLLGAIGVGGILALFNVNELRREISYADVGHYGIRPPEVREVGEYTRFIQSFLQSIDGQPGRVLFETSKARVHDSSHIAGFLAYRASREFIGGPYVGNSFSSFVDGSLFGQTIGQLQESAFKEYAELYNLRWAIVHTAASAAYFDQYPGAQSMGRLGEIAIYAFGRYSDYVLEGSGQLVSSAHNRVEFADLSGDEVILKYHYSPVLRSSPTAEIEPVWRMEDPVPYILIKDPPPRLTLFVD